MSELQYWSVWVVRVVVVAAVVLSSLAFVPSTAGAEDSILGAAAGSDQAVGQLASGGEQHRVIGALGAHQQLQLVGELSSTKAGGPAEGPSTYVPSYE